MFESADTAIADLVARVAALEAAAGVVVEPPIADPPSDPPAGTLTLTALSADHAPIGAEVTITGTGFGTSGAVYFGHRPMHTFADGVVARPVTKQAEIVSWSDTSIVALVPSMAPGLADAPGTHHPVYVEVGGQMSNALAFYIPPVTVNPSLPNSVQTIEDRAYTNSDGSRHAVYITHTTYDASTGVIWSGGGNSLPNDCHDVLFRDCTFVCENTDPTTGMGVLMLGLQVVHGGAWNARNQYNITFHNCVIANNMKTAGEGSNGIKVSHWGDSSNGRFGDWTFSDCSIGTPNSPTGSFRRIGVEMNEPPGGLASYSDDAYLHNIAFVGCDFEPCGTMPVSFAMYGRGPDRGFLVDGCLLKGAGTGNIGWGMSGIEAQLYGMVVRDTDVWSLGYAFLSLEGNTSSIGGVSAIGESHMLFQRVNLKTTTRYTSVTQNADGYLFNADHINDVVFDDCDLDTGDAVNRFGAASIVGLLDTCSGWDFSTSFMHGVTGQRPSPASVYDYFWVWNLTNPAAHYANAIAAWPTHGTRD